MKKDNRRGFTLVEMAIALIIIGLLIGGVLKGASLIQSARLQGALAEMNNVKSATNSFFDSYRALPGDVFQPNASISGCSTSAVCLNNVGDGNEIIGTPAVANFSTNDQSALNTEPTQYWIHLKLLGLYEDLTITGNQAWGDIYPKSPTGGGFQIVHVETNRDVANMNFNEASGHYFMLRLRPTGSPQVNNPGDAVLTPFQAAYMDRKIDDGDPATGDVIADDANNLCWLAFEEGPVARFSILRNLSIQTNCLQLCQRRARAGQMSRTVHQAEEALEAVAQEEEEILAAEILAAETLVATLVPVVVHRLVLVAHRLPQAVMKAARAETLAAVILAAEILAAETLAAEILAAEILVAVILAAVILAVEILVAETLAVETLVATLVPVVVHRLVLVAHRLPQAVMKAARVETLVVEAVSRMTALQDVLMIQVCQGALWMMAAMAATAVMTVATMAATAVKENRCL